MSTAAVQFGFLLQVGAKLTLLLGAVAVLDVTVLRRHASAATRHLAWTCATLGALLLPVLGGVLPALPFHVASARPGDVEPGQARTTLGNALPPTDQATLRRDVPRPPSAGAPAAAADAEVPAPVATNATSPVTLPSLGTILLVVYFAGVAVLLVRLVVEQIVVRRLVRDAPAVRDGAWAGTLLALMDRSGVRRAVHLRCSAAGIPPLTVGIVRPVLLIPSDIDGWTRERREAVVLHELAHVRRRDCLTQTLAAVACALYWPHPLAWWAATRLRVERELACDDVVIARGFGAHEYARHLLEIARTLGGRRPVPAFAVSMAAASQLEDRIRAAIDERRRRRAPSSVASRAAVAMTAAVVAPLAAAVPSAMAAPRPPVASVIVPRAVVVSGLAARRSSTTSAKRLPTLRVPDGSPRATEMQPRAIVPRPMALRGGQFTVRLTSQQEGPYPPGMVHLMLLTPGINTFYTKPERFDRLSAAQLRASSGDLDFSLRRDPGTLTFVGSMRGEYGTGRFEFAPDSAYVTALVRRGIGSLNAEQQFVLGLHGFPLALLDELARQGYRTPTVGEVIQASMSSVDLDYVRQMDSLGYRVGSLGSLVQLSNMSVTPDFIRELATKGVRGLSIAELVRIRNQGTVVEAERNVTAGVGPERERAREETRQRPTDADSPLNGRWSITPRSGGSLELDIEWADVNQWSRVIPANELTGFPVNDGNTPDASFRYHTDAGDFAFEGAVHDKRGSGQFTFAPNHGFAATLGQLGIRELGDVTNHDLKNLGFYGMSAAWIREFQALGLGPLTKAQVFDLTIREVTPAYVRELQAAGVRGADSVSVVAGLGFVHLPAAYATAMSTLGYRGVTAEQLMGMYRAAVTPTFVRRLQAEGQTNLTPEQLIDLRMQRSRTR